MLKVVLFEDNEFQRVIMEDLINSAEGMTCTGSFIDASNLSVKIKKSNPDVILMDIDMPGISGIEAVQKIKSEFPSVNILMQTVIDDDEIIFKSLFFGADGYLLKDTAAEKVIEAIRQVNEGGSPMSPGVARRVVALFKNFGSPNLDNNFNLSDREKQVLQELVNGLSYKLIADKCFISLDTVKYHLKNIYIKMHVANRSEAVAKAVRNNLFGNY